MHLLTSALLAAAGFPDALLPYIDQDTLIFSHARPNGTLEFMVSNPAEPWSAFTLVWHPEDPATWDYEDNRFFVKEDKFRDLDHYDPVGSDWVIYGSPERLIDWLDALPGHTPAQGGGGLSSPPSGLENPPLPAPDPRLDFAESVLALLTDTPIGSGSDFIDDVTRCATSHGLIEPDPARIVDGAIDEDLPEWRRTGARLSEPPVPPIQSGRQESRNQDGKPEPMPGRLPDETPDEYHRRQALITLADEAHGKEGECEFDPDAKLSEGDDNGTYVQAWVWVSFAGTPFDKEPDTFPRNLHPGDQVTWNDPDNGTCSRTGILSAITFIGDDAARITFTDGWSAEVLLSELS